MARDLIAAFENARGVYKRSDVHPVMQTEMKGISNNTNIQVVYWRHFFARFQTMPCKMQYGLKITSPPLTRRLHRSASRLVIAMKTHTFEEIETRISACSFQKCGHAHDRCLNIDVSMVCLSMGASTPECAVQRFFPLLWQPGASGNATP